MSVRDLNISERVGLAVRRLREEKGSSQSELSMRAGVSPGYLSRIEAGRENPRLHVLVRLALSLNVDPKDLLR